MSEEFTLNTGAKIPVVAFGTYAATGDEIYKAVTTALKAGYRHIDTAYYYQNEDAIGRAIKDSGIPREELFVTTKMWTTQAYDPAAALDNSLKALGLEYVDLYLVHWPAATKPDPENEFSWGLELDKEYDYVQIWEKFQELPKSKAKALGVSNFNTIKLGKLLDAPTTKVIPAANQCEFHPELPQDKLVKFCQERGIVLEAYCPLAQGQVNDPIIVGIAKKHNADPGQVALSWNVQRGVVVLPKSVTPKRIESNLKIIKLDEDDLKEIAKLGEHKRRLVDPDILENIYDSNIDS